MNLAIQKAEENGIGVAVVRNGTNPICVAVPAGRHDPIVFDAATSEAAFNKLFFAATENR